MLRWWRDSSILHADNELLLDALKREHDAELRWEFAIEQDIATKKEMERMIDNKATLKQEFHDLEKIVHERTQERECQEVQVWGIEERAPFRLVPSPMVERV